MGEGNESEGAEGRGFTAAEIRAAVRARPGMYIGDVRDGSGLLHMLWEALSNAMDEHLAGFASTIAVTIDDEEVSIEDDGRGIVIYAEDGRCYLDKVMTVMHDTGTEDGHIPHVHISPSLHGIGLAVVVILSQQMTVVVRRDGCEYTREVIDGMLHGDMAVAQLSQNHLSQQTSLGRAADTGTSIRFKADPAVFRTTRLALAEVHKHLQRIAYLAPGLRVLLNGVLLPSGDGLGSWHEAIIQKRGDEIVRPALRIRGRELKVAGDMAIGWCSARPPHILSFVSVAPTRDGGTHVEGMWRGLRRGLQALVGASSAAALALSDDGLAEEVFRERVGVGLVALVHAGLFEPEWENPTTARLRSPVVGEAIAALVARALPVYLAQYPLLRRDLVARLCG